MKYKIGDIAKILGVKTDTLRYYEKEQIVTPKKDSETNYRYYDFWDVNYLIDTLWFRSFDFPVKDIAKMITTYDRDTLYDSFLKKELEYEAIIKRTQLLLKHSKFHRMHLDMIPDRLGKCEIAYRPAHIHFINRYTEDFTDDPVLHHLAQEWLEIMPFTHRYFEAQVENIELKDGADYTWGMELSMDYAKELGISVTPPLIYEESCKCIHALFQSSGKGNFSSKHLHFMLDYAKEHNLKVCGNASGILIASVRDEHDVLTGYFEAWIPIE